MAAVEIRQALTEADREAVFAFRYAVIVEELGVAIPTADHERRAVIDPEDFTGHLFAASRDGTVVGALRVNFIRDGRVEPHGSLLGFDHLSAAVRDVTSVSSRFLVAARLRGTAVAIRITQTWYRFCRTAGIEWDYILVKPDLVGLYTRLGYCTIGDPIRHPEVGEVLALRLRLTDEEHLRVVRSPFVQCLAGAATDADYSGSEAR